LERTLPAPPGDALDVTATNVPTASIDLSRARRLQRDAENHDRRTDHDLADGL
jgi:hypothetical protein